MKYWVGRVKGPPRLNPPFEDELLALSASFLSASLEASEPSEVLLEAMSAERMALRLVRFFPVKRIAP